MWMEGGVSYSKRKGSRFLSDFSHPHHSIPICKEGQGQSSCSPISPTLEDHPLDQRHCDGLLRCPNTIPQCLQAHGRFQDPPDISSKTLMPLPIMMTYSLPAIPLFVYCSLAVQTPSQCITSHNPSFLTLHLPVPLLFSRLIKSQMTLMSSLLIPLAMKLIWTGIENPPYPYSS